LLNKLQVDLERENKGLEAVGETEAAPDPPPNIENPAFRRQRLRGLTARRDVFYRLAVFCILIVGILVGWNIFWLGNQAWGGGSDRLKCLFWGFGLHQITDATVAVGGLLGIRDWFRSSNSSAYSRLRNH
jgi:hypothetical protein